jgi:hypothetical protein
MDGCVAAAEVLKVHADDSECSGDEFKELSCLVSTDLGGRVLLVDRCVF